LRRAGGGGPSGQRMLGGRAGTAHQQSALHARGDFTSYDVATRDKIPVIRELLVADRPGRALDVGVGTGYTTYRVFGDRPTVAVDLDLTNLRYYRDRITCLSETARPLCVVAQAAALPFKSGSFGFVLCSEVLEHLEDDHGAAREMSRVLVEDGVAVITVPNSGVGFTSFLELIGIKTVHDFPGPEYHVRPGYDEDSLRTLLARHGLNVTRYAYYFRFFTRLVADSVSLGHLLYQRLAHRRRAWTWAEAAAAEGTLTFRVYAGLFPLLWAVCRIDRILRPLRGFGLVAVARKESH